MLADRALLFAVGWAVESAGGARATGQREAADFLFERGLCRLPEAAVSCCVKIAEGVLAIPSGDVVIPGRYVVFRSTVGTPIGVVHVVGDPLPPTAVRDLADLVPEDPRGCCWYYDALESEPRIFGFRPRKGPPSCSGAFYGVQLGIADPLPSRRCLNRNDQARDAYFLKQLLALSGSFAVSGLYYRVKFFAEFFEDALARMRRSVEFTLAVHVQAGPSAGQTVTFHYIQEAEQCLRVVQTQLQDLANGGHRGAPVSSTVQVRAAGLNSNA